MKLSRVVWVGLAAFLLGPAAAVAGASRPTFLDGPTISQADLVSDFDGWFSGMRALNPDLSIRADVPTLEGEAARIRSQLTHPMTQREAWLRFSKLNPYLRDAHGGIQMPDYRGALDKHLKEGGHVVPVEVRFAHDGSLRVFTVAPGVEGVERGDLLVSINGHRTDEMVAAMLSRSIGETPGFQHAFAERRFSMFYWYLYGDTGEYRIVVRSARTGRLKQVEAVGATTLPATLQPERPAAAMFAWRILPGDIGYIRVDGFDPDKKEALGEVSRAAFGAFKAKQVRAVIIDIRENGGGDDPLWQQELVNHFTTKPYVQLSHYVRRFNKDNAGPGDVIGTVKSADYNQRFTPPADDPVRYDGPVYILPGPYSYSAAIQFLVAAQDFGLAKIAGEETAAFSCQTGQVKRIDMPRTGLSASTPTIAYTRPSGHGCKRGVMPDVPVPIDEVNPDNTLDALVRRIGAKG